MRLLAAALLLLMSFGAEAAAPCADCTLPAGTYHAVAPPGWDGRSKLRLLLFLHGYMMEGGDIIGDGGIRGPAGKANYLLLAPDGMLRSWVYTGSPSQVRDDVAFLRAVVADVKSRWPIDPRNVVAAGFSQGGSMVWELACHAPADFTAFLPFSGGFWEPLPTACAAPVDLRHVHGREDKTVPLAGRKLLGPYRQGDIFKGFDIWAATDRCQAAPVTLAQSDGLECRTWTGCAGGHRLQLCLRSAGHSFFTSDIASGLRWAAAR